jgi:hypothetical protein
MYRSASSNAILLLLPLLPAVLARLPDLMQPGQSLLLVPSAAAMLPGAAAELLL